jgi:hypothetical protein
MGIPHFILKNRNYLAIGALRWLIVDDHKYLMNYSTGGTALRMNVMSLVVRVGFNVEIPHNEICKLYSKIDTLQITDIHTLSLSFSVYYSLH